MDEKELKKELARLRRLAVEIAGEIHDIVEDTLWVRYNDLPILSAKIVEAVKEAEAFKVEHNL
ncbi:MAG: CCE_0567 family metalloprotein [Sulfurospirillaceae bacterium]|nr:CCE_0567 family metalloprotein [Sulfurospirillaceae bacterium]